jgi:hypothetical protein
MLHIEYDTVNPEVFENFQSVDEKKRNAVFIGLALVLITGTAILVYFNNKRAIDNLKDRDYCNKTE